MGTFVSCIQQSVEKRVLPQMQSIGKGMQNRVVSCVDTALAGSKYIGAASAYGALFRAYNGIPLEYISYFERLEFCKRQLGILGFGKDLLTFCRLVKEGKTKSISTKACISLLKNGSKVMMLALIKESILITPLRIFAGLMTLIGACYNLVLDASDSNRPILSIIKDILGLILALVSLYLLFDLSSSLALLVLILSVISVTIDLARY